MSEELSELQEHAEHAKHDPTLAPVSVTMAILAVLVAVVSLLGHRAHTEEVVLQAQSYDGWAQYQAKSIRRHEAQMFDDLTSVQPTTNATSLDKLREKYSEEMKHFTEDMNEIDRKSHELEGDVKKVQRQADRFDLAEVFLEMGLVITSVTLLSGRRLFWLLGIVLGAAGVILAAAGFLIH